MTFDPDAPQPVPDLTTPDGRRDAAKSAATHTLTALAALVVSWLGKKVKRAIDKL